MCQVGKPFRVISILLTKKSSMKIITEKIESKEKKWMNKTHISHLLMAIRSKLIGQRSILKCEMTSKTTCLQKNVRVICIKSQQLVPIENSTMAEVPNQLFVVFHVPEQLNTSLTVTMWNQKRTTEYTRKVTPSGVPSWRMPLIGSRLNYRTIKIHITITCTFTGCVSSTTRMNSSVKEI